MKRIIYLFLLMGIVTNIKPNKGDPQSQGGQQSQGGPQSQGGATVARLAAAACLLREIYMHFNTGSRSTS